MQIRELLVTLLLISTLTACNVPLPTAPPTQSASQSELTPQADESVKMVLPARLPTAAPQTGIRPLAPDTVADDTVADDTVADDTVADDTVADDTVADDTVADDTVADDTVADDTVADDTVADDTVADDTVADDTVADDTVADDTVKKKVADEDTLATFANFIEEARIDFEIPGVAAAVVQGQELLLARGFGVRDRRTMAPVTPNTLFHIGSTHKSMTALLIATLVDDGLLAWDTPVIAIYPDFALSDPAATNKVTLRHLLSMSSGIPADAEDRFDPEREEAADLFFLLPEIALLGQPGEHFSYSNISAAVAGYIGVLATTDETDSLYEEYAALLQARVLDPIGMQHATLAVETAWANPDHASPHRWTERGAIAVESHDFTGDPLAPAGSLKANVLEMGRYLSTQLRRGIAPDGTRVVSAENLTATWRPQIADPERGDAYGMGWGIDRKDGLQVIAHEGSYDNFSALLLLVPEKDVGLVLLTNLDDPGDFLAVVKERFLELLR